MEVDADLRVCAIPAEGPLSGFPHCLQRAGAAGRRCWGIHVHRAKGLLDFLSTATTIHISGLNHAACILAHSSFVLPLLGWHVEFAPDLLATR